MIGFSEKVFAIPDREKLYSLTRMYELEAEIVQCSTAPALMLQETVIANISALATTLGYIKTLPSSMRMFELPSYLLPLLNHPTHYLIYQDALFLKTIKARLLVLGDYARQHGIKLSIRPENNVPIDTSSTTRISQAVAEIEACAFLATALGYGVKKLDFSIVTTLESSDARTNIKAVYSQLTLTSKAMLVIANTATTDIEVVADIAEKFHLGIVLDVHAHWVRTGSYITMKHSCIERIKESWSPLDPTLIYANSNKEVLAQAGHDCSLSRPDMEKLTANGALPSTLRRSSDKLTNVALNGWVLNFSDDFDIMCYSRTHNMAADVLHSMYQNRDTVYINK